MNNDNPYAMLNDARALWQNKPVLREIYNDYYKRMAARCVSGTTLEIGGGSGNLKEFLPDVISTDILPVPWLDVTADAQSLPFADTSFDNIVMLDVLHHIECPALFFKEAMRVLRPGGRIVMVEPLITPVSWIFYNFFHPELIDMGQDPLALGDASPDKDPFDANQAFPTVIFNRDFVRFNNMFPDLHMVHTEKLSLFAYPLSGGFRKWSLFPSGLVKPFLKLENVLAPVLGSLMGFRLFVCLERMR